MIVFGTRFKLYCKIGICFFLVNLIPGSVAAELIRNHHQSAVALFRVGDSLSPADNLIHNKWRGPRTRVGNLIAGQATGRVNPGGSGSRAFSARSFFSSDSGGMFRAAAGETQQWTKNFADVVSNANIWFGPEPGFEDVDSDGISEVYFYSQENPATLDYYDGATGVLKTQFNIIKPDPDWTAYGMTVDVDGDGSRELLVELSSVTPTLMQSKIQLYNSVTKALKWQSSPVTLDLAGGWQGSVGWQINNIDGDPQMEFIYSTFKTTNTGSGYVTASRVVAVLDGATKVQQWSKDFGSSNFQWDSVWAELVDVDSDGIPEVGFNNSQNPSFFYYYDGANGNLRSQLALTKPHADWVAWPYTETIVHPDTDDTERLYDVDGDGQKEFFIVLSSGTATQAQSRVQVYDAGSKALKWESSIVAMDLTGGWQGGIYWLVGNVDSDIQKEIFYTTNKSTGYWSGPTYQWVTSNRAVTAFDGSTKVQQWTKDFGTVNSQQSVWPELVDADSDGISEIYFYMSQNPATFDYYDGSTGALKAQFSLTRPNADWTGWPQYDYLGDDISRFYDIDGDGNKEFFVEISSTTAAQSQTKFQIYNAATKALKWESSPIIVDLTGGWQGGTGWNLGNIDSDSQIELVYTTSKSTSVYVGGAWQYTTKNRSVTALEYLDPAASHSVTAGSSAAIHTDLADLDVPEQAFQGAVSITVGGLGAVPPPSAGQTGTGVGIQITVNPATQPSKGVTITINYTPADVVGLNEGRLVIARYDTTLSRWIPLPSTVDTASRKVTAVTNHFSTFQIMQVTPSASVAGVTMGPNPYRPSSSPGQAVTFRNLPANGKIKIYTYLGELLKELSADGSGMAAWNGKNEAGQPVASGVYVALVQGSGGKKIFKIMVER